MKNSKLFFFGLDNVGKTTIINYFIDGRITETEPTVNFIITPIEFGGVSLLIWDLPGQKNLRRIWNNGFNQAKLMVFILDTSDEERFIETKTEFDKVLRDKETIKLPLIFCYHKMDLKDSKFNFEKAKLLFKPGEIINRDVFIIKTSISFPKSINNLKDLIVKVIKNHNIQTRKNRNMRYGGISISR